MPDNRLLWKISCKYRMTNAILFLDPGCDCGPNSMCENNDGKFACKCNPGYEMMEKVCKKCPPSSLCARIAFKGNDKSGISG